MVGLELLRYYKLMGEALIPFYRDRRAFVRQEVRGRQIFRRYTTRAKADIRIRSARDVLSWVRRDVTAFFGTLERDDGTVDFVVDVDRHELSLRLAALAAQELYQIFRTYGVRPAVNFSGEGGFHFWLTFERIPLQSLSGRGYRTDVFRFHRRTVDLLRKKLERRLQGSDVKDEFYQEVTAGLPITTSVTKRRAGRQIVLDRATNRANGCIRAPYSLHDNRRYVCLPLSPRELMNFSPELVTAEAAVEKYQSRGYEFKVPRVRAARLVKEVERRWGELSG